MNPSRPTLLPTLAATLALLAGASAMGCGGSGDGDKPDGASGGDAPKQVKDQIASFKYLPEKVRVAKGGTVTWSNQDKAPHTATAAEGAPAEFDTDRLELGESKAITFDRPGTYSYYCVYHRFMTGTVEVTE